MGVRGSSLGVRLFQFGGRIFIAAKAPAKESNGLRRVPSLALQATMTDGPTFWLRKTSSTYCERHGVATGSPRRLFREEPAAKPLAPCATGPHESSDIAKVAVPQNAVKNRLSVPPGSDFERYRTRTSWTASLVGGSLAVYVDTAVDIAAIELHTQKTSG